MNKRINNCIYFCNFLVLLHVCPKTVYMREMGRHSQCHDCHTLSHVIFLEMHRILIMSRFNALHRIDLIFFTRALKRSSLNSLWVSVCIEET